MNPNLSLRAPIPNPWPRHHKPHFLQPAIAVAVYNDQMPGFSFVQTFDYAGGGLPSPVGQIPSLEVNGITSSGANGALFLQGTFELLNGTMPLAPTVAQPGPGGGYTPTYWLNTITFINGNLFVIGSLGNEFGVLCFDAATGNPNGSGATPSVSPLFLSLDLLVENTGMSAVTLQGSVALVIPFATGLGGCLIGGTGAPSLKGPLPYSVFTGAGLPPASNLALTAPCESPNGNTIYFLYFDGFNPGGGAGLMSISVTSLEAAIALGATNIAVNVVTPLRSLPLTCAWCVVNDNGQDLIFVASPGWSSQGTPAYSLLSVNTTGTIGTAASGQPGQPWGVCPVTLTL